MSIGGGGTVASWRRLHRHQPRCHLSPSYSRVAGPVLQRRGSGGARSDQRNRLHQPRARVSMPPAEVGRFHSQRRAEESVEAVQRVGEGPGTQGSPSVTVGPSPVGGGSTVIRPGVFSLRLTPRVSDPISPAPAQRRCEVGSAEDRLHQPRARTSSLPR